MKTDWIYEKNVALAILLASQTLYFYKPQTDIIILDLIRQTVIYYGIMLVICLSITYYSTQENQIRLLELFDELDDTFRRYNIKITKYSLYGTFVIWIVFFILIFIHIFFLFFHYFSDYKFWTMQVLCGSIGFYRNAINFFCLVTFRARLNMLHEILIASCKRRNYVVRCACERTSGELRNYLVVEEMCHKHLLL